MDLALDLIAHYLGDYAYLGLFLILSVGAFGAPIPEEIVLIAAGLFVHQGQTQLLPTLLVCGAGQIIGDFLLFMVGRRWGTGAFHGFIRRLVPPDRIARVQMRLDRYGLLVVFFGRYLTGVRPAVFLAAGASGIPLWRFVMVDGASAVVSLFVWVLLGRLASGQIELILQAVTNAESLILAAIVAVFAVLVCELLLVRLGRLRADSAPVRVTHFVRVPILIVTITFAVVLARLHQLHQREHLIAAAKQGSTRLVTDMGLLLNVLPAITEGGVAPEIVLVGPRDLMQTALAKAGYQPAATSSPATPGLFARAPEDSLVRISAEGENGISFWLSNLRFRDREVWLGKFSRTPSKTELDALAFALTRSRFTPRTMLGPRLAKGDKRRSLVAVLRAPIESR